MYITRCDGCGKEVSYKEVTGPLELVVGVRVGGRDHDANVCSADCFAKVIVEKLLPEARETFERIVRGG